MSDPAELSLVELTPLLERRELSARELVQACLDRIATTEPTVRAFARLTPDLAMAAAARADEQRAAGRRVGPLAGVPVALKDLYLTTGTATEAGSRVLAGYDPGVDALVWQRLRAAGAGLLGKTTTHEFAYGTASSPTRNPWDPARTPGGSSGGSAAALAARSVPVAFGTDTCGSLRIPAAACGVSTLRAAFGRVPTDGVLPLAPSFDVAGPMARRMADIALLMGVVAGSPAPVRRTDLAGVRIGLPTALLWDTVDSDMAAVCRDALEVLAELGAELVDVPSPPGSAQVLDEEPSIPDLITEAEALDVHQQWLDQRELYTPQVLRRVLTGEGISAVTYLRARRAGREWTQAWHRLVEELQLDAVAHPTLSAPPPVVDPARAPLGPRIRSSLPWSVTGWPALSVPVGHDPRGLPVGLSLAAVPERETELVGLGLVLDDVLACWRAAPARPGG